MRTVLLLATLTACVAHGSVRPGAPVEARATRASSTTGLIPVTTGTGLVYYVLEAGTGPSPHPGQTVQVHYTGWLASGRRFDSSYDRGRPFEFPIQMGIVIKGWDQGIATMRVGERRQLHIPAALGYGAKGAGRVIPPDAALVFDVELVGLR
jgi:peptidylprolyl isomerase